MACEYCLQIGGKHDSRCPLAPEQKSYGICKICGEGIYEGEEYIENDNGEYIHYYCPTTRELVEFLGYKIKEMRCENN